MLLIRVVPPDVRSLRDRMSGGILFAGKPLPLAVPPLWSHNAPPFAAAGQKGIMSPLRLPANVPPASLVLLLCCIAYGILDPGIFLRIWVSGKSPKEIA